MTNFSKKHFFIFIITVFFILVDRVDASVLFNEVEINPSEGRFIELYNSSSSEVDLTGFYIQRKTATGSEFSSLVSKTYFEGKKISGNGYFVISKNTLSNSNIVLDSLTITESNTIQLKNSNQEVVDKIAWGDSLDCNTLCSLNPEAGKSLQKNQEGSWIISGPTPSSQNQSISNNENNDNDTIDDNSSSATSSTSLSSSSNKTEEVIYKISTKIIAPKIVTANIPFAFEHQTYGIHKEKVILGKFVWNFGDGMVKTFSVSDPFYYSYQYPGEYVVTLSFYDSLLNNSPDAVDRMTIKVIPSGITISGVGDYKDSFIELENKSNYEMSLHDWTIKGSNHLFIIPDGMIVLPGKKLKLSPKITGFDFTDLNSITISDSTGQVFATYPTSHTNDIKYSRVVNPYKVLSTSTEKDDSNNKEIIDLNSLEANAVGSNSSNILNKNFYAWFGLFAIIILGVSSVILLRRKNHYDDYMEKELKASDMTIIE